MLVELTKELSSIDSSLSLKLNFNNTIFTIAVVEDIIGTMYEFSSPSITTCYKQVSNYIECLRDEEKFDKLFNEIANEALGV